MDEHAAILNLRRRGGVRQDAATVSPSAEDAEFPEAAGAAEDDGPFFVLEFAALPFDDDDDGEGSSSVDSSDGGAGEKEIEIVVPEVNGGGGGEMPDTREPAIPAILLKSASKLRVLMLALKRAPRSAASAAGDGAAAGKQQHRRFVVKFEDVPIAAGAFFTREGSSRIGNGGGGSAAEGDAEGDQEKGISKEAVMRYLQKINPIYVRASKRYAEKLMLVAGAPKPPAAENASAAAPAPANKKLRQSASLPARFRVARKRLGKTMSVPLAPATTRLPGAAAVAPAAPPPPRRRDDTLLQQEDGIQGAIAHCKRSFNEDRIPAC